MSFPEAILITSPVAASGPNLADWLAATGTVGLALVTVITLIATVRIASVDRRHDDEVRAQDRRDAEGRLLEERQAADQRLREERNHAEDVRRQERRVDSAIVLLERIARIMPLLGDLPCRGGLDAARKSECDDAVLTLGSGVHTHAALVGQETLAQQYRNVVSFVDAVWTAKWAEEPGGDDLELLGPSSVATPCSCDCPWNASLRAVRCWTLASRTIPSSCGSRATNRSGVRIPSRTDGMWHLRTTRTIRRTCRQADRTNCTGRSRGITADAGPSHCAKLPLPGSADTTTPRGRSATPEPSQTDTARGTNQLRDKVTVVAIGIEQLPSKRAARTVSLMLARGR